MHCDKERIVPVCGVLDKIIDECKKKDGDGKPWIDAVFLSGDFWDSTITNSDASGFTSAVDKMHELVLVSTVFMIYGTPSHERNGSLHIFEKLGVIIPSNDGNPYVPSFNVMKLNSFVFELVAIPEPRLSLIEGKTLEEKYAKIQESYKKLIRPKSELPRVVMMHGLISGAVLDNGTKVPRGDTAIDKETLDAMNADVICAAHIHKRQQVSDMKTPCYYCGSMPPKNFGETHEARLNIFEI